MTSRGGGPVAPGIGAPRAVAYVLLSSFATEFMAQRVWGDITVGLLMGLGQFVTTFAITMGYVAFANRRLDPKAEAIRDELERRQGVSA